MKMKFIPRETLLGVSILAPIVYVGCIEIDEDVYHFGSFGVSKDKIIQIDSKHYYPEAIGHFNFFTEENGVPDIREVYTDYDEITPFFDKQIILVFYIHNGSRTYYSVFEGTSEDFTRSYEGYFNTKNDPELKTSMLYFLPITIEDKNNVYEIMSCDDMSSHH